MTNPTLLVLDYGGPYKELIARRVRECNVYSRIESGDISVDEIKELSPIGIILTGDAASVNDQSVPKCRPELFELGIPVLGIGYGMHAMTAALMGRVEPGVGGKPGRTMALVDVTCPLFEGLSSDLEVTVENNEEVTILPRGFENYGRTRTCQNAVMGERTRGFYGVDFHPEVDGDNGLKMIRNFLYLVCGASGDYNIVSYAEQQIEHIRITVGNDKVMLALSGGVDSSVCAALLAKALPGQVYCIFVDHGFLRDNELEDITAAFKGRPLELITVDARQQFLDAIAGISDPDEKKAITDRLFVDIFRAEAKKLGDVKYIARGTIYTDLVFAHSLQKPRNSAGVRPEEVGYKGIIEPIADLFKDEVRQLGRKLGLTKEIILRKPFPGLGYAARIIGEVTPEKLDILRRADEIFRSELQKTRCQTNQHFALLTDITATDIYGKKGYVLVLRAVINGDYTLAEYAEIPHRVLAHVSSEITKNIDEIVRVVYDITDASVSRAEW